MFLHNIMNALPRKPPRLITTTTRGTLYSPTRNGAHSYNGGRAPTAPTSSTSASPFRCPSSCCDLCHLLHSGVAHLFKDISQVKPDFAKGTHELLLHRHLLLHADAHGRGSRLRRRLRSPRSQGNCELGIAKRWPPTSKPPVTQRRREPLREESSAKPKLLRRP